MCSRRGMMGIEEPGLDERVRIRYKPPHPIPGGESGAAHPFPIRNPGVALYVEILFGAGAGLASLPGMKAPGRGASGSPPMALPVPLEYMGDHGFSGRDCPR